MAAGDCDSDNVSVVWRGATSRLDRAIRDSFPQWGRAAVDAAIATRRVRVNSRTVWMSSWKVEPGDRLSIHAPPDAKPSGPVEFDSRWLLADEGEYLVLDKPAGLRSEATRSSDTTPNLLSLLQAFAGSDLVLAHRLDRDTSGLILATRPGPVRSRLNKLFSEHSIQKRYVALVQTPNRFLPTGTIDCFVAPSPKRKDTMCVVDRGGKRAITDYRVLADSGGHHRLELAPRTGRMHQLRVQCAFLGGPILGDDIYGSRGDAVRLHLHAEALMVPLDTPRNYVSPTPF